MAKKRRSTKKKRPAAKVAMDSADAKTAAKPKAKASKKRASKAKSRSTQQSKQQSKKAKPAPKAQAPEPEQKGSVPWGLVGLIALILVVVVVYQQMDDARTEESTSVLEGADIPSAPEALRVRVIERHAHQTDAFTQGLLWHDGHLYESTGQRRYSTLRKVDIDTGEVLERRAMPDEIFAEGLARVGDELIQLSWQRHIATVYEIDTFEPVRTLDYEGEGWGLCYDGTHLVHSDGSHRLRFRDPTTFDVVRTLEVRRNGELEDNLNELECVDGVVWANIWHEDEIVRIDPSDGTVTAVVDASGLLSVEERWVADVLNGIAWLPERERFAITGKFWPYLYEVEFVPADEEEN